MKIVFVGPGILPIPNDGFGAVESLIYDYYQVLKQLGHDVHIVNTPNQDEIISSVNNLNADIVHLEYDCFVDLLPYFKCRKAIISSHYPYIDQFNKHAQDGYGIIFRKMIERCEEFPIFAISEKDRNAFINWGANPNFVIVRPNGASSQKFRFTENPKRPNDSITLAQINSRKRQWLTSNIPSVYYWGNGVFNHPNYEGEARSNKYTQLTEFGNMVLLSEGENGTCLAVKEGLMAGLGIVVSEAGASELPWDLPFIDIIPEKLVYDEKYVEKVIINNRKRSIPLRKNIRQFAVENWDWELLVKKYVQNLESLLS
jgi:glycosyltransferase involved in cell wall biosynthesis